ncbi:hypothetical protein PVAP13_9NG251300 [Panicum virgatum]|uniref:Cytochrome b561 domain-containing protein n=2 Tax=Panicum virgatum TaxID=38727 RepID=A0A8T0MIM8_PANVG|nr:hypothetical protein PVAP13_9NG251300 [Panicum virgatum]
MAVPAPAKVARACGHGGGARASVVHPVLMLIGFIILGSEAIMSYKILPWSHDTDKIAHMVLHAVALFLGSVGIYAAFKFHNESGIANLYSLHSWVGLGTICLYGIQWLLGVSTFFYPGASPTVRRRMLPWHVRSGTACGRVGFPGEAHLPSGRWPRQVQLGSPAGELHSSSGGTSWRFCCAVCHCPNAQRAHACVFSSAQALSH